MGHRLQPGSGLVVLSSAAHGWSRPLSSIPSRRPEPTRVLRLSLDESAYWSFSQTAPLGGVQGPTPTHTLTLPFSSPPLTSVGTRPFLPQGCSVLQSPRPPFTSPSVKALPMLPACSPLAPPLQEAMALGTLAPRGPITKGLGVLAQAQSWC